MVHVLERISTALTVRKYPGWMTLDFMQNWDFEDGQ